MNEKKLVEVDTLRAISALAVITIHVTAAFTQITSFSTLQISMAYIDNLSGFAVPSFIFISGLVLYGKYNNLKSISEFYRRRFYKMMPPYVLFSMLYISCTIFANFRDTQEVQINMIRIVYQLLTGGAFYHFWYFAILFQFYLLFPVISWLYKKNNVVLLVCTFIIQYLWGWIGEDVRSSVGQMLGSETVSAPFFSSHVFWFVLGFWMSEKKEQTLRFIDIRTGIILVFSLNIIRTLPLYYGLQEFKYENIPSDYFTVLKAIDPFFYLIEVLLFYKLSAKIVMVEGKGVGSIFSLIAKNSLEIYLIHALVIVVLAKIASLVGTTPSDFVYYPVILIGVFLISYLFAVIYNRAKVSLFLSIIKTEK